MTRRQTFLAAATAFLLIGALSTFLAAGPRLGLAQDRAPAPQPLLARGFTDAPTGMVVISGAGGNIVSELRVKEGQQVKRDEIIAVLSNYALADIAVRSAEAELEQAKRRHDSLVAGVRSTRKPVEPQADGEAPAKTGGKPKTSDTPKVEIPEQEAIVKLTAEEQKLKEFEMQRSALPSEERAAEVRVSEQKTEREIAKLKVLKEALANDLAESEGDINIKTVQLERARIMREQGLVRSPMDGTVVQIWTRPSEAIGRGIAQIVDMSKLRVLVDLDERLIGRIAVGGKVDVVFHGEKRVHQGKILRIATTVKRMESMGSLGTGTTRVDVVQVEVALDDPSEMPQMLGREAEVTFL